MFCRTSAQDSADRGVVSAARISTRTSSQGRVAGELAKGFASTATPVSRTNGRYLAESWKPERKSIAGADASRSALPDLLEAGLERRSVQVVIQVQGQRPRLLPFHLGELAAEVLGEIHGVWPARIYSPPDGHNRTDPQHVVVDYEPRSYVPGVPSVP